MEIHVQKVLQGDVEFFVGKIKFKDLSNLVSIEHRIIVDYDDDGHPIYNNKYQRKLESVRVSKIKDFLLNDPDASFPNSILLSVPSSLLTEEIIVNKNDFAIINIDNSKVSFDVETPNYIQIIDGQHRYAGLRSAFFNSKDTEVVDRLQNFEFVISFFIDPPIDYQALLFSTINRNTKNVSKDLAYDLFGLEDRDSPQKTCLVLCLKLNKIDKEKPSPFERRIKLLGKKNKGENSYISQQIFIRTILKLICTDEKIAEVERFKKREYYLDDDFYKTIFRKLYGHNEDLFIYKTLFNFFNAVQKTFIDQNGNSYWVIGQTPDNVLQRTIGFLALIDILIPLYHKGVLEKDLSEEFFIKHLEKVKGIKLLSDDNSSVYTYNTKGKNQLRDDLLHLIA